MTIDSLNNLKILTSIIAPILTFVLALLGSFTEKKKEKEFKSGELTYKRKVLSAYGKTIITLMIISALLTLSGLYVDRLLAEQKNQIQRKLDAINNAKRDLILNTARITLDTVKSELKLAQDIQAASQRMSLTLANQTEKLERLNTPLFPMQISYTYIRKDPIYGPIHYSDNNISCKEIIDCMNLDLGTVDDSGVYFEKGKYIKKHGIPDSLRPYYVSVQDKISYNNPQIRNANLNKLSRLIYDKFAPFDIELDFHKAASIQKTATITIGKVPKIESDIHYTYFVAVYPPDSLYAKLEVTVTDPYNSGVDTDLSSWSDLKGGTLDISYNLGYVSSIVFNTGSQFSYSKFFSFKKTGTMNTRQKVQIK